MDFDEVLHLVLSGFAARPGARRIPVIQSVAWDRWRLSGIGRGNRRGFTSHDACSSTAWIKTYRGCAVLRFGYPNSRSFGRSGLLLNVKRRCSKIGPESLPDPTRSWGNC